MRLFTTLLGLSLGTLIPQHASADCAEVGLEPRVLNSGGALPANGGLVVGAMPVTQGKLDKGDASVRTDWRMRSPNTAASAPKIETVAPGLSVYRPAAASKVELADGAHVIKGTATFNGQRALLAAPAVKKLVHQRTHGMHGHETVTATLDGAVPPGALAIIMIDAKTTQPRSFSVLAKDRPVTPYNWFDCTPLPNGTVPSRKGDKVKVMWLDDAGRLSPASSELMIE